MHLPTYIGLMIVAMIYDCLQLVDACCTNYILCFASFLVFIITLAIGITQCFDKDSFQLRLMLTYSIPVGILAFGQLAGLHELQNDLLQSVKLPPLPSDIPGVRSDYESAVYNHYISMIFPLVALGIAWIAQYLLSLVAKHK